MSNDSLDCESNKESKRSISERLKFLEPELSATHSRIDVLETICQANTDRIEAISKHQFKADRDFSIMSNDLWYHALTVLYGYRSREIEDVEDLYRFEDKSGVLEKHREHMDNVFGDDKGTKTSPDVKTVYFELAKMLMDADKGLKSTQDVDKIQGFQELTNKMLINRNAMLERRLDNLESILNTVNIQMLDQKVNEAQDESKEAKERLDELENNVADNQTRISSLETTGKKLEDSLEDVNNRVGAMEDDESTEKLIEETFRKMQVDMIDTLSKRIDSNENHIKLLEQKDDDLESRLDGLEQADNYFQKALEESLTRTDRIEKDESNLSKDFSSFKDDFSEFKNDQDTLHEKINGKLQTLTTESDDLKEETDKIKELVRNLEGVTNENANAINEYIITHEKFEAKFSELDKVNNNMDEKVDAIEVKLKDHDNELENLKNEMEAEKSGDKVKNMAERLAKAETDVKSHGEKIDDANLQIKKHQERFFELEDDLAKLSDLEKQAQQTTDKLNSIHDDSENFKNSLEYLKESTKKRDEEHDEMIKENKGHIINLLEHNANQQAQAKFVEALNEKMKVEQETHRQSAAQTKEEMKEKMENDLERVKKDIMDTLNEKNADIAGELSEIKDKMGDSTNEIKAKINDLQGKSREIEEDVDSIRSGAEQIKQKLADLGREKDEVDNLTNKNKSLLEQLMDNLAQLEEAMNEANGKTNERVDDANGQIKIHWERILDLEKNVDEKLDVAVKDEIEKMSGVVNDKLNKVDEVCNDNAKNVENLRELNKELLDRIKNKLEENVDKNKGEIDELRKELDDLSNDFEDLKKEDIQELFKTENELKEKVEELDQHSKKMDDNLKQEQERVLVMIKESKETQEKMMNQLLIVQKVQDDNQDIQMLKNTIDSLENRYLEQEQARADMNEHVGNIETRLNDNQDANNERWDSADGKLVKIETAVETNYEDMWNVVLPIYGALRSSTVQVYSSGAALQHQSACLGIYRFFDHHDGRPLYKQDAGECYLYYQKDQKAWVIGPHRGSSTYVWIKNALEEQDSSSSSSSSDSDASMSSLSSSKKSKRIKKRNKLGMEIRTPDQLETPWKYRLSIAVGGDNGRWENDETLCVKALKDPIYLMATTASEDEPRTSTGQIVLHAATAVILLMTILLAYLSYSSCFSKVDRVSKVIRRIKVGKEVD